MDPGWNNGDVLKFHHEIDELNWQFGGKKMHYNFLHRWGFLPHAVVYRGGEITRLNPAPWKDLQTFEVHSRSGRMPLEQYFYQAPINGGIFVHHGQIVFECYPRMRPADKYLLVSVTKVFISLVIALLESRGQIDVHRAVDEYLPMIKGSGWADVSVQDVLDMASGIDAPEVEEGFLNPDHPYYQYEASLGWLPRTSQTLPSTYQYVAGLRQKDPPGQEYEYTSVNTFLLAWLAESLTGLPLNEILAREIWSKIGAEADGLLAISAYGAPAAHGGLCATLRDVGDLVYASLLPAGRSAKRRLFQRHS